MMMKPEITGCSLQSKVQFVLQESLAASFLMLNACLREIIDAEDFDVKT